MKTVLLFIVTLLNLLQQNSYAQVDIPYLGRPETLLLEAQTGRKELLEVLLRIKDNVRELRDQPTFDQFFAILPQLEQMAKKQNLEMIYPGAVKEVGKSMIMHGNRWLKVSRDDSTKILSYQVYADIQVALQFKNQVEEELQKIAITGKGEEFFRKAYVNLLALLEWSKENFPNDFYLVPGYKNLLGDLSLKALINTDIGDRTEWTFWIKGLNTQSAVQEYFSFLNEKILSDEITEKNAQDWFDLVLLLGNQINTIEKLSIPVKNNYGVLVSDLTAKAVRAEVPIEQKTFESIVEFLDGQSLRGLTYAWVTSDKIPTDKYALGLLNLSKPLYARAKKLKLGPTVLEIERFVGNKLTPALAIEGGLEGNYKLTPPEGSTTRLAGVSGMDKKTWFFTMIRESEQRLIASLCDERGNICYAFFNVQYDLKENIFKASENYPNDEGIQNTPIKITFGEDNKIRLDTPYAYRVGTVLTGRKIEHYKNMMADASDGHEPIDGHYRGVLDLPSGPMEYDLLIQSFGEYSIARLYSLNGLLWIDLNKGTSGKDGFIYLTSGRNTKGSWVHLRLERNCCGGGLSGVYIMGGMKESRRAWFSKYYGD